MSRRRSVSLKVSSLDVGRSSPDIYVPGGSSPSFGSPLSTLSNVSGVSNPTTPLNSPEKRLGTSTNVKCAVRIRPISSEEKRHHVGVTFRASEDAEFVEEMKDDGESIAKNWSIGKVYGPDASNQFIFHELGTELVEAALDGYNAVIFAYGQTSSGKTYTLFGNEDSMGLVDHALHHLQDCVSQQENKEFCIKLAYIELYNEEIRDLLAEKPSTHELKIIEDPAVGPSVHKVTEQPFLTADAAKAYLKAGETRRHFGVTNMNSHSSRSHVLVRLVIESRSVPFSVVNPFRTMWGAKDKPSNIATLNLVDLAGSERANKAGTSGAQLKEGSYINKSLLTLGTVISHLAEGKDGAYIPYRNSKLTRLLSTALGGNARTTVIANISPAFANIVESVSTLRFAQRAKKIVNRVKKNDIVDMRTLQGQLHVQEEMIEHLKAQLADGGNGSQSLAQINANAIATSNGLRSMLHLVHQTPRIVRALRVQGVPHHQKLMEQLQQDLHLALSGRKDLQKVIHEQTKLLDEYLPLERRLRGRGRHVLEYNERELILEAKDLEAQEKSFTNTEHDIVSDSNEKRYKSALFSMYDDSDSEGEGEEDVDHVQAMSSFLTFGSLGGLADIETIKMGYEDHLSHMTSTMQYLLERNEELRIQQQQNSKRIKECVQRNESMQINLSRTREQCTFLEKDAASLRNTHKEQLDNLRANMHSLLTNKKEATTLLQDQNMELHRKLDAATHLSEEHISKSKSLDLEVYMVRKELDKKSSRESGYVKEIASLSEKVIHLQADLHKIKKLLAQTEIPRKLVDQQNTKLRLDLEQTLRVHEDKIKTLEQSHKVKMESLEETREALQNENTDLRLQISSLNLDLNRYAKSLEKADSDRDRELDREKHKYESLKRREEEAAHSFDKKEGEMYQKVQALEMENWNLKEELTHVEDVLRSYDRTINRELQRMDGEKSASGDDADGGEGDDVPAPERRRMSSISMVAEETEKQRLEEEEAQRVAARSKAYKYMIHSVGKNPNHGEWNEDNSVYTDRLMQAGVEAHHKFLSSAAPSLPSSAQLHPDGDSGPFSRIRAALLMTNCLLRYSVKEDAQICKYLTNRNTFLERVEYSQDKQLDALKEQYSLNAHRYEEREYKFQLLQNKQQTDGTYIEELESTVRQARKEATALIRNEAKAQREYKEISDAINSLRLQCSRQEMMLKSQSLESRQASMQNQELHRQLEEALVKMHLVKAENEEKTQRLAVLQAERDGLAQQFYQYNSHEDDYKPFNRHAETERKDGGA